MKKRRRFKKVVKWKETNKKKDTHDEELLLAGSIGVWFGMFLMGVLISAFTNDTIFILIPAIGLLLSMIVMSMPNYTRKVYWEEIR